MRRTLAAILVISALAACGARENTGPAPQNTVPAATAPTETVVQTAPPTQVTGPVHYSFIDRFNAGHINSNVATSTPTGKGALVLEWPFGAGNAKSLTLVATYRYTYPPIAIAANDVLTFEAAKPLAVGGLARAAVDVTDGGKTTRLFQHDLPAATSRGLAWQAFAVDLKRFAGHRVIMTFSAEGVRDGGLGAWVAFARPGIYSIGK